MFSVGEVEKIGQRLLKEATSPAPRFHIMRDILKLPPDETAYTETKLALFASKWVRELQETQIPDGTWGRFHSRDSSLQNRFPTTELAIYRGLSLGLDKTSLILQNSIGYMQKVLNSETTWTDPIEKHEGWPINLKFITAATLARIDPSSLLIQQYAQRWTEVTQLTFQNGGYDPAAEKKAHLQINGIKTQGKYLKLASLYPMLLLATTFGVLPKELECLYLDWVWHKEDGIYYIYGKCLNQPPAITSTHFQFWLEALAVFSGFKSWKIYTLEAVEWLWAQKGCDGLWDFGPAARNSFYFPLSDNWRDARDRKIDCSIMVLSLLRRFVDE
jgi:hypothetical protein